MSKGTGLGCSIVVAAITLVFGLWSMATIPAASPPVTASPPLIVTIPAQETDAYFVPADNQITYTNSRTMGQPCYYIIAGRVFDLQGEPFTDFVVNIRMIDELAPQNPGYAFPGEGGDAADGPSRWITLLPQSPVEYEIWLTTAIGGEQLSSRVIIPPQSCGHNMAIVDFVQVRPLP